MAGFLPVVLIVVVMGIVVIVTLSSSSHEVVVVDKYCIVYQCLRTIAVFNMLFAIQSSVAV